MMPLSIGESVSWCELPQLTLMSIDEHTLIREWREWTSHYGNLSYALRMQTEYISAERRQQIIEAWGKPETPLYIGVLHIMTGPNLRWPWPIWEYAHGK